MKNIPYQTDQIARYFAENRVAWHQFYESERVIINGAGLDSQDEILDIGCGCGGLGLALRDQFGVGNYTGVEINAQAVEAGRTMNPKARFLLGDILDLSQNTLGGKCFDAVFSLSCVDWNIRFSDMLAVAWSHVKPGGRLIATFRLTVDQGCNDFEKSYQYINFKGVLEGERAAYVVLNAKDLMQCLFDFAPAKINAYGYWGTPSATAVTPYKKLCFAAFSIQKRLADHDALHYELKVPPEIQAEMGLPRQ